MLISVNPAHAQTTSTAPIDVTFSDVKGQLLLPGHLYLPTGQDRFRPWWRCMGAVALDPICTDGLIRCNSGDTWSCSWTASAPGKSNICDSPRSVDPQYVRMPDADAAKAYLARQPFVDGSRIALMGWSHGGSTTLYAADNIYLVRLSSPET